MDTDQSRLRVTRRDLVVTGASTSGLVALGAAGLASKFVWPQTPVARPLPGEVNLPATPGCARQGTVAFEEGPYYTPNSPRRSDLRQGGPGRPIQLSGRVTDTRCRPIAGAVVDVWHADAEGAYDNVGYGHRGHVHTDADGRYTFTSILPDHYVFEGIWRARHVHLKAQGAGTRLLTSQLFFPLEPESNQRDIGFDPRLVARVAPRPDGALSVGFDIVLERA